MMGAAFDIVKNDSKIISSDILRRIQHISQFMQYTHVTIQHLDLGLGVGDQN